MQVKGTDFASKLYSQSSLKDFIKTRNGERALIAAGTFLIASIL